MLETILSSVATPVSLVEIIIAIGAAALSGLIVSFTYMKTHPDMPSRNFALTLVLLPAIISVIIMLIGSDVARAFSLAGAFSIIRFRSAPGEPKDITLILFGLAAGLAAGSGVPLYALIFTVILCLLMLMLDKTRFGFRDNPPKLLQITIPEDLDYEQALPEVLEQYTTSYKLKQVKMTAMGSLYVLQYQVMTPTDMNIKEFIDKLRARNGNLAISFRQNAAVEA